ncbi:MAG: tyrosine--tRNA ligase [Lentisphaerae bacterium]|nr:tyrosine--tRNA ligase [Lentisphaerota bacterium]OQC13011.1 MAG: Tyrosine--tRNA ligase [Lentisphaerae bacterium ADurb.Bin082]
MTNALDILKERGFIYQITDEDAMSKRLAEGPATFYVGFDPTGSSLHIGHLLPVMAMRWLQKAGHRPIALVGGGTAMIGDPSGKTEARPISDVATVDANAKAIQAQLGRFLDFTPGKAIMVNNADWLRGLNLIDFLRDIGRLFSIPRMLSAESVQLRLETGLSFLEFSYPLLQSYDFYILRRDHGCQFQFGGQDQWGNIVAGVDLTRRLLSEEVFGATFPLLLKSDGTKFGKTAGGAVWLDAERTAPFDYYQFWRNVDDADVTRLLSFFTSLPMSEVRRLGSLEAPQINRSKEILAYEATALAHGHDEAIRAFLAAGQEFGFADPDGAIETSSRITDLPAGGLDSDIPTLSITAAELGDGIGVLTLLVKAGLCASNGEARRLIKGGGCYLGDARITDEKMIITAADFADGALTLRAGKKARKRVLLAS